MGLFGSHKPTEQRLVETCVNFPNEAVVESLASKRKTELTEFYIIHTKDIMQQGDKVFYAVDHLLPLTPEPSRNVWPMTLFHPFSDGNTTIYMFEGAHRPDTFSSLNGQQMCEITPDGKLTLHLSFFKLLADQKMALVKISAPRSWHAGIAAARARLDPTITCVWTPKFEKRPA